MVNRLHQRKRVFFNSKRGRRRNHTTPVKGVLLSQTGNGGIIRRLIYDGTRYDVLHRHPQAMGFRRRSLNDGNQHIDLLPLPCRQGWATCYRKRRTACEHRNTVKQWLQNGQPGNGVGGLGVENVKALTKAQQATAQAGNTAFLIDQKTRLKGGGCQLAIAARQQRHLVSRLAKFVHGQQGLSFASPPAFLEIQHQNSHGLFYLLITQRGRRPSYAYAKY